MASATAVGAADVPVRSPSARMVAVTSARPPCVYLNIGTPARVELLLQIVLGAVDDRQVRPQSEDALEVGIEQRPDARQRSTSGGSWS